MLLPVASTVVVFFYIEKHQSFSCSWEACNTRLYVCTPHMYSLYVCCNCFYGTLLSWVEYQVLESLYTRIFMQLYSHNARFNVIRLNQLKSLFVCSGQNWSFCSYWNNAVDQCVGSRLPVSCDVWKGLRICRDFHSSFSPVLLGCPVNSAVFFF